MKVVDVDHVFDGLVAEFVGCSEAETCLTPAPASQAVKPLGLWSRPCVPFWNVGMRPNSVVQTTRVSSSRPRSLQVHQEGRGGLVEDRCVAVVIGLDAAMAVPVEHAFAHGERTVVERDESHAALRAAGAPAGSCGRSAAVSGFGELSQ